MNPQRRALSLILFAVAMVELATSLHRPGGEISMWLHGLREAYPGSGALYALSSSPFLALVFSVPLLLRADAGGSRRLSFLAPLLPYLLARQFQGVVAASRVAAVLLVVWSFLGSVQTLFMDPYHFRGSWCPLLLLGCACLLRFVLLDLPREEDIRIPRDGSAEEIGTSNEAILYSRPAGRFAVVIDFLRSVPRLQQMKRAGVTVKLAGERAFLFLPGSIYVSGIPTTIRLAQTAIRVGIDVAVTRHPDGIRMADLDLSAGLPTQETIRSDVKLLISTHITSAIREHDAFTELEKQTAKYLSAGTERPGRVFEAVREFVGGLETIRQDMATAADALTMDLASSAVAEQFDLCNGLFHCRVYLEDIRLSDRAEKALQETRHDLMATLEAMQADREANILGIAELLKATENLDLRHTETKSILRGEVGASLPGNAPSALDEPVPLGDHALAPYVQGSDPRFSSPTNAGAGETIFGRPL